MGRRKKLSHFQDLHEWTHVIEPAPQEDLNLKGSWGDRVILELACGQGAYTLALAERDPQATVVGVDIKGARLWHGALAAKEALSNVRFLRARIEDLGDYFGEKEVDEIWITFPDPHLREGRARKRLTSERFLKLYETLLKPSGRLHLKTDSQLLYDFTKEVAEVEGWTMLRDIKDLYAEPIEDPLLAVQTPYEKRYVAEGRTIKYLCLVLQ